MANPDLINVTSIVPGNAGWSFTAATYTALLLTVDANKILKINSMRVSNSSSSDMAVNLYVAGMGTTSSAGITLSGASATTYFTKAWISLASSVSEVLTAPIYLMEGDELRGGQEYSGDNIDIFISYEILDDA
jgi:hypothetical protein